ncbi:glycosyltransferase [Bacillus sp. Marseille-Q1617]|uniref:glycosyltransferase n=1 Tax=Bacillus sp. Marseille-Q1617 TaxID=2736887 RepID=UPI00158D8E35|nr:glycosyltransferase [Bacillus sp. Marseille-Q1617]
MKQVQSLILLTSRFPYSPGEEFIYNEVKVLAEKFEKVIIVPTNQECWNLARPHKRDLPGNVNVEILKSPIRNLKYRKMLNLIKGFTNSQVRSWYKKDLNNASRFGLKGKFKLYKWIVDANQIQNQLGSIEKAADGSSIYYSYWLTPAAASLAMEKEKRSIKAVSRVHGGDLYSERHALPYLPLQEEVIRSLDKTYSISSNGKQYLANKFPEINQKIEVSRLGTKGIEHSYGEVEQKSDELKLVSVSYLKSVKRVHLIAEAIKKAAVPIHWIHIGDGPEKERIQHIIEEFPAQCKGELVGNFTNDEVIQTLGSQPFDLFLNVSESEGIPVTIMEAFSAKIPAIATNVGGTTEVVNDRNGWLLDKDFDPAQITQILNDVFKQPDHLLTKREKAYRTWKKEYFSDDNYARFAENLQSLGALYDHEY